MGCDAERKKKWRNPGFRGTPFEKHWVKVFSWGEKKYSGNKCKTRVMHMYFWCNKILPGSHQTDCSEHKLTGTNETWMKLGSCSDAGFLVQGDGFLSALLHATGRRRRSNVPCHLLPATQCVSLLRARRLVAEDCLFAILYCSHSVIRTIWRRGVVGITRESGPPRVNSMLQVTYNSNHTVLKSNSLKRKHCT